MKSVDVQQFESNNEVFEIGSYHGISILIRKSDGYINATKLCKQPGKKEFYRINDNDSWKEFCNEIIGTRKIEIPQYVLKKRIL